LALPRLLLDRDPSGAEGLTRRALELEPGIPQGLVTAMMIASMHGRSYEAVNAMARLWELDTLSYHGAFFYAEVLAQNRRFTALAEFVHRVGDVMPPAEARGWEGVARFGSGDCAGAVPLLRQSTEIHFRMDLGAALVCAGRRDEARALLDSTVAEASRRYVNAYFIAALHVALGDYDAAFAWLDRADEERTGYLAYLPTDFRWDPIRSDPRFAALLARLGLGGER